MAIRMLSRRNHSYECYVCIVRGHKDAVLHYVPEDRDIRVGESSGDSSNDEVTFVLNYRDDAWMVTVETKNSSTTSPGSSGGSDSGLNV